MVASSVVETRDTVVKIKVTRDPNRGAGVVHTADGGLVLLSEQKGFRVALAGHRLQTGGRFVDCCGPPA